MLKILLPFLFILSTVDAISPKSQYFNISQQVLDLTWGSDGILERRYDLQRFLCKICDQIVNVAKVYVRNNQVKSGEQLIGFLSDQHYFDESYESCSRKYEQSFAKAGNFLACSSVLEPLVEELKQNLQQHGANIVKENKQICYEKGLQLCEQQTHIWNILGGKASIKQKFQFFMHSSVY